MPKARKPYVVDKLHAPYGGEIFELYLDRERNDFYCDIYGEELRFKTFNELKDAAVKRLREITQVEWIPVIEVEVSDSDRWSFGNNSSQGINRFFNVKIDRYYLGQNQKGSWMKVDWKIEPERRLRYWHQEHRVKGELQLPILHGEDHILAYSVELWAGLCELQERVIQLRERLMEMLRSEQGIQRIAAVGADILHLLPDGKETNDGQ